MLLNDFYSIISQESGADSVKAVITFNSSHKIFEGHFPGHPVVPGVCMMQTVRELMEIAVSHKLRISTGDNMKFLSIIDPGQHKEVEVAISYTHEGDVYTVTATLLAGKVTFFKFKGTLQKA